MTRKKTEKQKKYAAPDLEAIEVEMEGNILQSSGEGTVNGLQDFGGEYW